MASAAPILDYRQSISGGFVVAVNIWRLPGPVPGSSHPFKYSLFFGRPGERIVGYDNERGKGDHRHYGRREDACIFVSVERLMADFRADILRVKGNLW